MYQTKFSILLSARIIPALIIAFMLTSCGFHPLYANKDRDGARSCSNFTVERPKNFDIAGQQLQYKLQDALNQACIDPDHNFNITMDIGKNKNAIAIQKDREVTRYNLMYSSTFMVFDRTINKEVYRGTSNMVGGYDAQVSDYGTYALEADTETKLLEEMANDMTLKISSGLLGAVR